MKNIIHPFDECLHIHLRWELETNSISNTIHKKKKKLKNFEVHQKQLQ
jgi:hypothetical protein